MHAERRGRTLLPSLPAGAAVAVLSPPRLPADSAARLPAARAAAAAAVPVLLSAPAAAGRLLLARALHAEAHRPGPLVAVTGRRPALDDLPPDATLYLDVTVLAPEAALALEAVLDDGLTWVLAAADPALVVPPALAPRLQAVVLAIPPLSARRHDLPTLAAVILARLAARAGRDAPRLSAAALAQLAAHPWAGDVAELEAVLARLVLGGVVGDVVEVGHLGIGPTGPEAGPAATPAASPGPGHADLELLLAELAHELRNPLVTIKTFARHLPALLEDAQLRERFTTLCDEAVERMDGLLENVLGFARLGAPRRQTVEVPALLERVVAELGPELAGRGVRVERPDNGRQPTRCSADPEHLAFALRNLLTGVAREVPARQDLVVDAAANGVVTLRFATASGTVDRLRRLVGLASTSADEGGFADPTLLPLAFRLARSALERGGGALEVMAGSDDATTVVVRLPTAGPEAAPTPAPEAP